MLKEIIRRVNVLLWTLAAIVTICLGYKEGEAFFGALLIGSALCGAFQYLTTGTIDPRKVFRGEK